MGIRSPIISTDLAGAPALGARAPRATQGAQARTSIMRKLASAAMGIVGLVLCASSAVSHHSEAMFDPDKVVTVSGTVTEFQYVSPHVWLFVMARDDKGA